MSSLGHASTHPETLQQASKARCLDDEQQHLQQQCWSQRLALELIDLAQFPAHLPNFLAALQHEIADFSFSPLSLVLCYPDTQECFFYHAAQERPSSKLMQNLRRLLMTQSQYVIQAAEDHVHDTLSLDSYHIQHVLTAHDHVVWRMSRATEDAQDLWALHSLDQALKRGFAVQSRQHQMIQQVLASERRTFSADLHDSIAQIMGFLRLKSAKLHQQCKQLTQAEIIHNAEEVATYTHYAYQQVRELITASRLTYQAIDFVTAVKKVVHEFEPQSSVLFELDIRTKQVKLSSQQSIQLLYILRESLSNVVRHSQANTVRILLEMSGQHLQLQIQDDGIGIQLTEKRHDSFGLDIMQERAERIGAHLSIESSSQGTCVQLKLHLSNHLNP